MDHEAAPGLREQLLATIGAVKRLARAHLALARAEAAEIVDEVKRLVGLALGAIGLALLAGLLLFIGGTLFLGEWLFGSIGWGVLDGALVLLDLALVLALLAVGIKGAQLGRALAIALVLGLAAALVLGLDLAHRGWSSLGDQVAATVDPAWRATVTAVVALALLGAVLGFGARVRAGFGTALGAALGIAVLGAFIGLISAAAIPAQVGAALGVVVGLVSWPILCSVTAFRAGIDGEALKARFTPDDTIAQTKETIEWVRARVPLAPKS